MNEKNNIMVPEITNYTAEGNRRTAVRKKIVIRLYISNPLVNRFIYMNNGSSKFINKVIQRYINNPDSKIKLDNIPSKSEKTKVDLTEKCYSITISEENSIYIKDIPEKKRKDFIKLILNSMLSIPDEWIQEEFKVTLPKKKAKEEAVPAVEGPEEESIIIESSIEETKMQDDTILEPQNKKTLEEMWNSYTFKDEWNMSDDYMKGVLSNLNNMD